MRTISRPTTLALLVSALSISSFTSAQPAGRARPDRAPDEQRAPGDGTMFRERLERRLAERRAEVERLEAALRRLDEGATPEQALREMARAAAPGEQPEPGPVGGPPRQFARERVLAFLREHNPEFARQIDELAKARPEVVERAMLEIAPRIRELAEVRQSDPELFRIRLEAHRVDWTMRRTVFEAIHTSRTRRPDQPLDLESIRDRLAPMVAARFQLSLQERAHTIAKLEQRISALREETINDEANAPQIIQDRMNRLMEHVSRMASGGPGFDGPRPERPGRRPDEGSRAAPGGDPPRR